MPMIPLRDVVIFPNKVETVLGKMTTSLKGIIGILRINLNSFV